MVIIGVMKLVQKVLCFNRRKDEKIFLAMKKLPQILRVVATKRSFF